MRSIYEYSAEANATYVGVRKDEADIVSTKVPPGSYTGSPDELEYLLKKE